jgi:hypothetical protein
MLWANSLFHLRENKLKKTFRIFKSFSKIVNEFITATD